MSPEALWVKLKHLEHNYINNIQCGKMLIAKYDQVGDWLDKLLRLAIVVNTPKVRMNG